MRSKMAAGDAFFFFLCKGTFGLDFWLLVRSFYWFRDLMFGSDVDRHRTLRRDGRWMMTMPTPFALHMRRDLIKQSFVIHSG